MSNARLRAAGLLVADHFRGADNAGLRTMLHKILAAEVCDFVKAARVRRLEQVVALTPVGLAKLEEIAAHLAKVRWSELDVVEVRARFGRNSAGYFPPEVGNTRRMRALAHLKATGSLPPGLWFTPGKGQENDPPETWGPPVRAIDWTGWPS